MATPAFGFSAGDLISAVNLIVDVSKALKRVGGASDDYQSLVAELGLLQKILGRLQARSAVTTPPTSGDSFTHCTKEQVNLTLNVLSDFLSLISKFESRLGVYGDPTWHRGIGRKVQWAIWCGKEIDCLRKRVSVQLGVLNLLLHLQDEYDPILGLKGFQKKSDTNALDVQP